jgi:hypothetical protein
LCERSRLSPRLSYACLELMWNTIAKTLRSGQF